MNQVRAILYFNKFKSLKNKYVIDTLKAKNYKILKVKLVKLSEDNYEVKVYVKSDLDIQITEIDSTYANQNFKETSL